MMKVLRALSCIIVALTFLQCNYKRDEDLELTIYNEEIVFSSEKMDSLIDSHYRDERYIENKIISFSIENKSNYNYVFMPISKYSRKGRSSSFYSFPRMFSGLSLQNILVKNDKGESIKKISGPLGGESEGDLLREREISFHFEKLNQQFDKENGVVAGWSIENLLLIPAKTKMYFESYISLPRNRPTISPISYELLYELPSTNSDYTFGLVFYANKSDVLNRLTRDIKRTVLENDFKIFDGTLCSNEIPLRIVKRNTKN